METRNLVSGRPALRIAVGVVVTICALASAMSLVVIAISQRQDIVERREHTCLLRATVLEAQAVADVELAREAPLAGEYYEDYAEYLDGARSECR